MLFVVAVVDVVVVVVFAANNDDDDDDRQLATTAAASLLELCEHETWFKCDPANIWLDPLNVAVPLPAPDKQLVIGSLWRSPVDIDCCWWWLT